VPHEPYHISQIVADLLARTGVAQPSGYEGTRGSMAGDCGRRPCRRVASRADLPGTAGGCGSPFHSPPGIDLSQRRDFAATEPTMA